MVGAMLNLLQERSALENTYVVFTSDNGAHMGEHRQWLGQGFYKNTAYEEAANVPLAVRGPGIPANQVRPQLVLNNDFAPTFADIADAPVPQSVDGRSLLPLMNSTPRRAGARRCSTKKWGRGPPATKPSSLSDPPMWSTKKRGKRNSISVDTIPTSEAVSTAPLPAPSVIAFVLG
jgi:N-acetylglucosamine-6-sulfatase